MKLLAFSALLEIVSSIVVGGKGTVFVGDTYASTYPRTVGKAFNDVRLSELPYNLKSSMPMFERGRKDVKIDVISATRTSELMSDWSLLPIVVNHGFYGRFDGTVHVNLYTTGGHDQTQCQTRRSDVKITCLAGEYYKFRGNEIPDIATYFDADIRLSTFVPTITDLLDRDILTVITFAGRPGSSCSKLGETCFEVPEVLRTLGARVIVPLEENVHAALHSDPQKGVHGQNVYRMVFKGRDSNLAYGWHSATNVVRALYLQDIAENYYHRQVQDREYAMWLSKKAEQFRRDELTAEYPLDLDLPTIKDKLLASYRAALEKCHADNDRLWASGVTNIRPCTSPK